MEGKIGDFSIAEVIRKLKKSIKGFPVPSVKVIAGKKDPFAVLISCLISLRTRDEVTESASARLFSLAKSPAQLLKLSNSKIEKAIYPAAFFRNKTRSLKALCKVLVNEYSGKVPETLDELLNL